MTAPSQAARIDDRRDRFCVIGAGSGGLTAAKNLLEVGVEVDVIEREHHVGGIWNPHSATTPAYQSIHLITSKPYIEYTDYPIPEQDATYLGLHRAHAYLDSYARHFGVMERIEFGRTVELVDRVNGHADWLVRLDGGETRRYGGVVIAHGHNSVPRLPSFPGRFEGETMHAAEYDVPSVLAGKRVLVVGAGTSGADIAVESSQHAAATYLSIRRGCYFWPKYVMGMPIDQFYELVLRMRLPRPVLRQFAKAFLRLSSAGDPASYGLPHPPHKLLEEHFVINSTLLYHLGHGRIATRPDIAALDGRRVRFVDGRTDEVDLIVYATGYEQTQFPFIDRKHLNWSGRIPEMHLHLFHPDYDNLFLIGYFQTSTGNWRIMDYQSQLMARYVHLNRHRPAAASWLRAEKGSPRYGPALNGGISFYDSERHWLQVEHVSYRAHLRRRIRRLDDTISGAVPGVAVPGPAAAPRPVLVPAGDRADLWLSLAWVVLRDRWLILLGGVVAVAAGLVLGLPVLGQLDGGNPDFVTPSSGSEPASERVEAATGAVPDGGLIALVDTGEPLQDPRTTALVQEVVALLEAEPALTNVAPPTEPGLPQVSEDGTSEYVSAQWRADAADRIQPTIDRLTEALAEEEDVHLGGSEVVGNQVVHTVHRDLARAEGLAFPLLFVLSLLIFRSLIASAVPLLIGGLNIVVSMLGIRLVDQVHEISIFSLNLVTALGLGLAIDYSLLVISRFRAELAGGKGVALSLWVTINTAGRTVAFSALTVAAAMASLFVFQQRFLVSMAVGGILVTLTGAVAALTVLPALLAVLGHRIDAFSPRRWRRQRRSRSRPPAPGSVSAGG